MTNGSSSKALSSFTLFWLLAAAITLFRIVVLFLTEANLGPDEAQYWFWSREPAFGYYSKPPMIAWAIGLTTAIFGNEEWAVRLSAPLFHSGTAGILFLLARRLYGAQVAFWTGLGWLSIPGVILSSVLITTDAPLLFFLSAALFFFFDVIKTNNANNRSMRSAIWLGLFLGLAFLSKYAAIYFLVSAGLVIVLDKNTRDAFIWKPAAIALIVFALLAAPNIYWNAQNDFQTVAHTAANANWGAALFGARKLPTFLAGQFAVFGVIPFAGLLWVIAHFARNLTERHPREFTLLIFVLTPLLIVSFQAFVSRAHANWAAAAYPAAMILVTGFLFSVRAGWVAKSSVVFHTALMVLFVIGMLNFNLIDRAGLSRVIRDIRGWEAQTRDIAGRASGIDAIMIDDRGLMGEMLYYQRNTSIDIVAWNPNASIDNHYEAFRNFDPAAHERLLFVTTRKDDAHVNYRFSNIKPAGVVSTPQTANNGRIFHLFEISGHHMP